MVCGVNMLESICFKIGKGQIDRVDDLIRENIFFSRAEVFRAAIRHFLKSNLVDHNDHVNWMNWQDNIGNVVKNSVSTKLPHGILRIMDEVVLEKKYESRSAFIREAIDSYLNFNQRIFDIAL